jgi:hypothetical protein
LRKRVFRKGISGAIVAGGGIGPGRAMGKAYPQARHAPWR